MIRQSVSGLATRSCAISIFFRARSDAKPAPTFADRALLKTDRPRIAPRPGFLAKAKGQSLGRLNTHAGTDVILSFSRMPFHLHPRCSFCESQAAGTARARGTPHELRRGRSAHRRDYPSP